MGIPLLILCLDGPLQSWGDRSRWTYRETESMPTKSGVIGLLSCAMGLPRYDPQIVQLDQELTMGIRADKLGSECVDFHTVKGVIQKEEGVIHKTKMVIHTAANKELTGTIVTYRHYLQDARFMIVLKGKKEILQECEKALNNPKWVISLGRKSCVPTRAVLEKFTEEYSSIEDALREYPLFSPLNNNEKALLCEIEKVDGSYGERQDRYQNNPARMYGYRKVDRFSIPSPKDQSSEVTT